MSQQQGSRGSETKLKSSQRFHSLNTEQVEVLHQVLSEVVPIHGRGNFPTLELRPRDIIITVRARLQMQGITVRDVRLNGSTASHVLVCDNGSTYKDLDIIFGVELPSQEEFQVIKESVLGCLLDCLPAGVSRERISSATMKEAYVQKMVKVFNEYDRWSLISLSNNSGKNLELKFVSAMRRQFEFSVDSFQIILDRLLESYIQQDSKNKNETVSMEDQPANNQNKSLLQQATAPEKSASRDLSNKQGTHDSQTQQRYDVQESESKLSQPTERSNQTKGSKAEEDNKGNAPAELNEEPSTQKENVNDVNSSDALSDKNQTSKKTEPSTQIELVHEAQLLKTKCSTRVEHSEENQSSDGQQSAHLNHKPLFHHKQSETTDEPDQLKTSDETQNNSLKLAEEQHTLDFCTSFSMDQQSSSNNKIHVLGSDSSYSSQRKIEEKLPDVTQAERETEEQKKREKAVTVSEQTGGAVESGDKNIEDTQDIDCSGSSSSISLTRCNTQLTTDNTDKTPDPVNVINPKDTQDNFPPPPSLALDKETSPFSCKTSNRLSHMVVLKYSSPKPPRRMCRKVTPNQDQGSVSEREPNRAPCVDADFSPSLQSQTLSSPTQVAPVLGLTTTHSNRVSSTLYFGTEINTSSYLATDKDRTVAHDPTPDIISSSARDPVSALSQEQSSCKEIVPEPEQLELDSVDMFLHTDTTNSNTPKPVPTSDIGVSNEDENRELRTKGVDLNQLHSSTQETTLNSPSASHSVTPPILSLSPPCLSPPLCLTPLPLCLSSPVLSNISSAPSLSSTALSFSPTSSSLCSPPHLTPPMFSLSPPPHCLTPPSPCLSPPLLCLTPPVESEDLVPQVSLDIDPSIMTTDNEEHIKESSPQPEMSNLHLEDINEQRNISSLPQVAENVSFPISFPITIPSSTTPVLPQSQCGSQGESASPKSNEASSPMPENQEVPKVTTDMLEQSRSPQVSESVPAVEVLAESMYGDFEAAMDHLRYRLIATRNPEEIRGGGLLKYSNLLVRDYRPASETQIKTLERYMCSRFFIDFPDVQEQQRKILSYLKNHFIGEERSKYQYLMTLRRVVDDSTVCLMGHERRQTLNMITILALKVLGEQNIIPNTDHVTCFYQPAPYLTEHSAPYLAEPSYCSYYIPQGGASNLLYQPYPLHLHTQAGLV